MQKEIELNSELGAFIASDGSGVVFYTEEINPEVLESVIDMWNDGKPLPDIIEKLEKRFDELCTAEEREYIQTQIENWSKLSGAIPLVEVPAPTEQELESLHIPAKEQADSGKGIAQDKPLSRGEKAAATRKANAEGAKKTSTGSKAVNREVVIQNLKDAAEKALKQIDLIEWIERTSSPEELPVDLSKAARDLLLQFGKDIETLKGKYITAIQEL